jgi:lipoprotein-releasing system permease protein
VLAIFWSMISEKTKDIGVLRALGASTPGVAWLWLRYGAAIGVVGATLGLVAGYLIVTNINAIHDWMGEHLGLTIWDPAVYYFVEIPREVEPLKATIVFSAGVLTCLLGALIPAVRSARMDPVKALRFE